MTDPEPHFDMLSAYVDGELDPPEASRLARRITADEVLAPHVAKLFEMKEGVAELAPEVVVVASRGEVAPAGFSCRWRSRPACS